MHDSTFIKRVTLKNYKSIPGCSVELTALSFLVGPNGAGKSNFLDALRFVRDALRGSLDHALRDRGGIKEVRRKSAGHPTHFGIRLELIGRDGVKGSYAFDIGAQEHGGFAVKRERCTFAEASFDVRSGQVASFSEGVSPASSADRLFLVHASGFPKFRAVYEALSGMGFYNLNPEQMRELQSADPGELLSREGENIASVLERMTKVRPSDKARIEEYLSRIVPGVEGVDHVRVGPKESLEFRQCVEGVDKPWRFPVANMSDGTLRALGILVALFHGEPERLPLVGIEEPETALHPAAAGVLLDALRESSRRRQIIVTSHSPDLLDDKSIPAESIVAVVAEAGQTKIGLLDEADRSVLRDRLYSAGELLRANQLQPASPSDSTQPQLSLFDDPGVG